MKEIKDKLIYHDITVEYIIQYSARKTIGIQMTPNLSLVVRAPLRMSKEEVDRIVGQHRKWIYQKYHKQQSMAQEHKLSLESGQAIPFMGKDLIIEQVEADSFYIALEHNKLRIGVSAESKELQQELIAGWYKNAAKLYFEQRVLYWAEKMKLKFGRITIKSQKTLWGSCSSKRNLNFNWKLIMMPPGIMDYVIVHELAHLQVMNHSIQFWEVVKAQLPDYMERSVWLKEHGKDYEAGI